MNLLKLITPINLQEEEVKFFASASYHPQFKFAWDYQEIMQWVAKIPKYNSLTHALLNQENITSVAEALFQVPWNQELLHKANQIVCQTPDNTKISPREIQRAYQQAIKYFGLNYSIDVIDEPGFVGRPQPSRQLILISKYAESYFFTTKDSACHEMTHVIRYENGQFNQIKKNPQYLPTEEGLATFNQDYSSPGAKFQHAAEYAVTEIARQGSLRQAVEYLASIGFPPKLAWQRAARHKFGFKNTSQPGDIMKPAMYFAYCQTIACLSPDERLRLFVGKISIDDLPSFPHYQGKWSQEIIQEFFYANS